MRRFLRFHIAAEARFQPSPDKPVTGAKQHPLDVAPVAGAIGKCLEHDQIFRRARVQTYVGQESTRRSHARSRALRTAAHRVRCRSECLAPTGEGAPCSGGRTRRPSGDAPGKRAAELFDVVCLAAEAGQDGETDVSGEPGLPPALQRDAADEAEPPPSNLAERLDFICQEEQILHFSSGRRSPAAPPARSCSLPGVRAWPRMRRSGP